MVSSLLLKIHVVSSAKALVAEEVTGISSIKLDCKMQSNFIDDICRRALSDPITNLLQPLEKSNERTLRAVVLKDLNPLQKQTDLEESARYFYKFQLVAEGLS